ncbi:histidine phosphatase family protein [Pseudomonas sp. 5P_3.1_Bac2]|uniref:lipopolysaccharide core heptose(II)-phosphate phosphatase PmrG n=1 Tax=Pseudomonas sp. 5P_3.1_Bac2 TaxID=2971617 RepID=UPI0021C63780|nr:histidine phosphatase family protein [Pseudomonas sp. 5P_3.1_Bac2]MCU1715902.1 histidine phosphatase family protein [Pseudomonas sp. 5P_3.1_Bac2]
MFKPPLLGRTRQWLRTFNASQRKRTLIGAAAASLSIAAGAMVFDPAEITDLSEESRNDLPKLLNEWEDGNVIVLLRHLERCDKEDHPCLQGNTGVTSRSVATGDVLADSYSQLGLDNSNVYNSPLTRTAQTESIVFNDVGIDGDWLLKCRENMLHDVLRHKQPGKNLILVTHSSCISAFEEALGYESDTPAYGTSLFFSKTPETAELDVLGFLDANDWEVALDTQARQVGAVNHSAPEDRT